MQVPDNSNKNLHNIKQERFLGKDSLNENSDTFEVHLLYLSDTVKHIALLLTGIFLGVDLLELWARFACTFLLTAPAYWHENNILKL